MVEEVKKVDSTLTVGVYSIYDCVLKQFEAPFSVEISKVNDYLRMMVNDIQSRFYNHENDYILNKIGDFDNMTGEIQLHFIERIATLDSYIDEGLRRKQLILQNLNFLPVGYFKMSDEQKKVIQEKIDNSIIDYVQEFIVPDLDKDSIKSKLST